MIYRPLWLIMILFFRVYFKRFYISGLNNWVKDKPVIMPCNHVNAFLDPIMLPSQVWQKVYFIVRGDIFNTPVKRWILWNMNQLPMFRQRDGSENVKRNEESFERCYDLLRKKQRIMIFSEGDCVQEKRLRPIKKGTARMAFGAVEKYGWDIDVQILPNTVNYTHPSLFRTEVLMKVGQPIRLLDYKQLYEVDAAKAMTTLTRDIEAAMKKIYIHVDDRKDLKFFEQLIEIERNDNPEPILPWRKYDDERFNREQHVANCINKMRKENPDNLESLKSTADEYFKSLQNMKIEDANLAGNQPNTFVGYLLGVLGFPLFLAGLLIAGGQHWIANWVAKHKIKLVYFKNSIRMGISIVLNLIVVGVLMTLSAFYSWWLVLIMPFVLFLICYAAIQYYEYIMKVLSKMRFNKVERKNANGIAELRKQRLELIPIFS